MENKSDKISVLIGTYNRSQLLLRCVNSIFNQTYKDIEVIVINDASVDNTEEVLKELKNTYQDQFKYITNKENRGIAYNSNLAFKHSSGEYIALIGDDDYWIDKDKLKKQLKLFKGKQNVGVVGTWWIEKSDEKEIKKAPQEPNNWKSKLLAGGGVICGSTPLISRKVWVDIGGFDEKMNRGTDSELFRRIILNEYKAKILPEFTTVVDISHNYNRMTPIQNIGAIKKSLDANVYLLKKFKYEYLNQPMALFARISSILKMTIKYIIKKYK